MTKQEINENNKLIAEFMDLKIQTDGISWFDENFNALKRYDNDWNSLMPVVEKIENIYSKANKNGTLEDLPIEVSNFLRYNGFTTNINKVHEFVVEFIKWHNENK